MKHLLFLFTALLSLQLSAQTTAETVYNILQTKCATSGCHSNADAVAGLDLEGSGANAAQQVYDAVFNTQPANSGAAAKGNRLIYPGDPYKSFLFRKINNGLSASDELDFNEGQVMPPPSHPQLTDVEKEIIRQWINYGATLAADDVDIDLIDEFYGEDDMLSSDDAGLWSIDPQDPPAPPAEGEGFQIHMGPFFLPASSLDNRSETELFTKWDTQMPEAFEINGFELFMGSSHHFIVYYCEGTFCDFMPYGLRDNGIPISRQWASAQSAKEVQLPEGTAFKFGANEVMDLNSHYINFSFSAPLACEVYMNVYTQPDGTAAQEMFNELLINFDFSIPPTGDTIVSEKPYTDNIGDIHVWRMSSHTHEKGVDFDIWQRNPDGSKGEYLFDAQSYNGVPGCEYIAYDYSHPPERFFAPFLDLNMSDGIIHKAQWVNNSNQTAQWGDLSTDEMMITTVAYVNSLEGVTFGEPSVCLADEPEPMDTTTSIIESNSASVELYPNPFESNAILQNLPVVEGQIVLEWMDINGRLIRNEKVNSDQTVVVNRNGLSDGMYILNVRDESSELIARKKVILQ